MKTRKEVILELGNCPLNASIITRIAKSYLIEYGHNWTLRKTHQWEIVISHAETRQSFINVEEKIVKEIERLSQLYWDLETLGLVEV